MSVTEEYLNIVCDTANLNAFDAVRDRLAAVAAGAESTGRGVFDLGARMEALAQAGMTAKLSALDPVNAAMEELTGKSGRASLPIGDLATATEKTGKATSYAAQGMLQLSRGVEDFTTGGPIGVLNNIPGIFENFAKAAGMSVTALAGWTTGISLAATAAYALWKNWDSIAGLFSGELLTALPQLAKDLDRLTEAHKENEKAIEEMRKKTQLNGEEMLKYNELIKDQSRLEGDLAIARETEANKKKLGPGSTPEAKNRADAVEAAVKSMGGYEATIQQVLTTGKAKGGMDESFRGILEQALNLALKGDESATNELQFYGKRWGGVAGIFGSEIDRLNPATIKAKEKAAKAKEKGEKDEEKAIDQEQQYIDSVDAANLTAFKKGKAARIAKKKGITRSTEGMRGRVQRDVGAYRKEGVQAEQKLMKDLAEVAAARARRGGAGQMQVAPGIGPADPMARGGSMVSMGSNSNEDQILGRSLQPDSGRGSAAGQPWQATLDQAAQVAACAAGVLNRVVDRQEYSEDAFSNWGGGMVGQSGLDPIIGN